MQFLKALPETFLCPCLRYLRRFRDEKDSAAIEMQGISSKTVEETFNVLAQFYRNHQSDLDSLSRKYRAACKVLQKESSAAFAVIEPFLAQNKQGMQKYFETTAHELCQIARKSSSPEQFQIKAKQIEQRILTMIQSFQIFHPQVSLAEMCTDALAGNIEAQFSSLGSFALNLGAMQPQICLLTNFCSAQFSSKLFTNPLTQALSSNNLFSKIHQYGYETARYCLNQRSGVDGFFLYLANCFNPWKTLHSDIKNAFLSGVRMHLINSRLPIIPQILSTANDRAYITCDASILDPTSYAQLTLRAHSENEGSVKSQNTPMVWGP